MHGSIVWKMQSRAEEGVVSESDVAQEAWVFLVRACEDQGRPIPQDATMEQIQEHLSNDGGLVQNAVNIAKMRTFRDVSHDTLPEGDAMIDSESERAFGLIEGSDQLQSYLETLTPKMKKAVHRFITLWSQSESGQPLTQAERAEVYRLRKSTGLALALK